MARYRVKPGSRFGARNEYGPGDIVELSEEDAKGFADKLTPVIKGKPAETQPAPMPSLKNDLGVEVPGELKIMEDEPGEGFQIDAPMDEEEAPEEIEPAPKKKRSYTRKNK